MHNPSYTLEHLARVTGARLQGDADFRVSGLADIQSAGPTELSFIANKAYSQHRGTTAAGALLLRADLAESYNGNCLVVDDPYRSYAKLSQLFEVRPKPTPGVHPTAVVAATARIAPSASVGPHCVIEDDVVIADDTELAAGVFVGARTTIGRGCRLYPRVTLYHDISVGNGVTVHSATVIGSDGFGFAPSREGWEKIYQLGRVTVGDDVEIGASCTIDRGALEDTTIGNGVIIDNQVHVAHNVKIGDLTAIAGCVGIAGSTEIGARCLIGGGVLVAGHIKICDGVQFHGATVVTKSIREPGVYASGTAVQPVKQWQKNAVRFSQLNDMFDRLKTLENNCTNSPVDGDQTS